LVISHCCFAGETSKLLYQKLVQEEAQDIKDQLGGELKISREDAESLPVVREKAKDKNDKLGEELKTTTQGIQTLEEAAREESREIKDKLGEMHQFIDRLSSSAGASRTWEG